MYTRLYCFTFITFLAKTSAMINFNDFFTEQSRSFMSFLEEKGTQVEEALASSYDTAAEMKSSFDQYVEKQQKEISEQMEEYIENVKDQGRQIAASLTKVSKKEILLNNQNPDVILSVPARISRHGYVCETHTVISEGYVLNLHRIPHGKERTDISQNTVILQHGVLATSSDWILNGPGKGLAYVLADAGYDVWMSNVRGNRYSSEHTKFNRDSKSYWDFSWHEIALYDIPNVIDYIMKEKGEGTNITYIGHSMGTSILFAMLALRPEYNEVLTAGYALAPVVFMTNFRSPVKTLAPIVASSSHLDILYGSHEFISKKSVFSKITGSCTLDLIDSRVCKKVIFEIMGENEEQFNETLLPAFLANFGGGTSWKTIVHFAQEILAKDRFQYFDLGLLNYRIYGDSRPLQYDLTRVTLPIKLFWSRNDLMSGEKDVMSLLNVLPSTTEAYMVPDPKFNHLDYLWSIDAPTLINNEILSSLEKSFGGSD
ncbi:lipase 3-like [Battus philenor]|uniref:lipase 3-like n=1 Tax=Battus philenor TaxID=42288 RepID=UPI0035D02065